MSTLGIVIRPGVPEALTLAASVEAWASERGLAVIFESGSAVLMDPPRQGVAPAELIARANPIITLGGDGTLLGIARNFDGHSPIFVGVNFGNLGFLTEILPEELFTTIEEVLNGSAVLRERPILRTEMFREGVLQFSSLAINDAVIVKGARSRLIELDLYVDREAVMRLRADGLIIATPTGSTAYSMAAGGAIASPTVAATLVTPICAHSLTSRPLVLDLESELRVAIPAYDGKIFLTVDGQVSVELQSGDQVRISKADTRLRFVRSLRRSYFHILRTKLNWGIPNKATE